MNLSNEDEIALIPAVLGQDPGVVLITASDHDAAVELARRLARARGGNEVMPTLHAGAAGLMSELAVSACGTFVLTHPLLRTEVARASLFLTWRSMSPRARPLLVVVLGPVPSAVWESACSRPAVLFPDVAHHVHLGGA